jgi:hypothetical protein
VNLEIKVDPSYKGPSLGEQITLLDLEGSQPVEATWTGSKQDFAAFKRIGDRKVTLYVPHQFALDRASNALGYKFKIRRDQIAQFRNALVGDPQTGAKSSDWRGYFEKFGAAFSKNIMVRDIAHNTRTKTAPDATRLLRKIAVDCVLNGVSVADADVLLGLRKI